MCWEKQKREQKWKGRQDKREKKKEQNRKRQNKKRERKGKEEKDKKNTVDKRKVGTQREIKTEIIVHIIIYKHFKSEKHLSLTCYLFIFLIQGGPDNTSNTIKMAAKN